MEMQKLNLFRFISFIVMFHLSLTTHAGYYTSYEYAVGPGLTRFFGGSRSSICEQYFNHITRTVFYYDLSYVAYEIVSPIVMDLDYGAYGQCYADAIFYNPYYDTYTPTTAGIAFWYFDDISPNKNNGETKSCSAGNPINTSSGNKFQKEVDFDNRDSLGGFHFERIYNNYKTTTYYGMVNSYWRTNFDRRVFISQFEYSDGIREAARLERPDGKTLYYDFTTNTWESGSEILESFEKTSLGYKFTTSSNIQELYDASGLLVSIVYPNGYTQTLTYTESPSLKILLERIYDSLGNALTFTYYNDGFLKSVTAPGSRVWTYRYNTSGELKYVDNPDGATREYFYAPFGGTRLLTGITDERYIRYATFDYEVDSRDLFSAKAILSTHANNVERVDLVFNPDGTTTVTNSRGLNSTYTFVDYLGSGLTTNITSTCADCVSSYKSLYYDPANNNLLSKTINGITTEYGNYNVKGDYGYIIEAAGTPEARRTDYTYDPRFYGKVETVTEPSVYASSSKVTTYGYDDFGNTTSIQIDGFKPDGSPVSRVTTMQYNGPFHQLSQIDGPRTDVNDITTFDYYPDDPAEGNNRARLRSVTGPDGTLLRNNIGYTPTGKIEYEYRPNNNLVAYFYYPGNDRLAQKFNYNMSTGESRWTNWTYLPTGEVETITTGANSVDATTITIGYDDARRLTKITDGLGNYIEYVLDTEGNVEQENYYDQTGVLKKTLAQTFDAYDRLDTFIQKNESQDMNYRPDGKLDKKIDGKSTVTDYGYDNLLRLTILTQDFGGTGSTTANALTQYGYNVNDKLISVIDANNGQTSYTYDDLGNLLSQTSPDIGVTTFTHDEAGNVLTKIDAKGQLFSYIYDANNRLTGIDALGTEDDVNYNYDTCTLGVGKLCLVVRNNSTLSYRYNGLGDVEGIDQSMITWQGYNQADDSLDYIYDKAGRLKAMTYPSGAMVTYSYDAAGNTIAVTLDHNGVQTPLISSMVYLPFGPVIAQQLGNGLSKNGFYDTAYRQWIVGDPLNYEVLYYDQNGNISSRYTTNESQLPILYDAHQRLISVNGTLGNFEYDYDKVGNRTRKSRDGVNTASTYEPNSNRLDTLGSEDVTLDENGNITNLHGMSLIFTTDNRLKDVANKASFQYNGMGQRTMKSYPAPGYAGTIGQKQSVAYMYGLKGELLAELGPSGKPVKEYIYLNEQPLVMLHHQASGGELFLNSDFDGDGSITLADALIRYFNHRTDPVYDLNGDGISDLADTQIMWNCGMTQGSCETANYSTYIYYIHNDHLGAPMAMSDESGQAVWRATATPFGETTVDEDVDGDGTPVTLNIRYPGQYYDSETGLHYNYFRYYDPKIGRYITADPIGFAGLLKLSEKSKINHGSNLYAYVGNNPLYFIDPYGLAPSWVGPTAGVVGATAGLAMVTGNIGLGIGLATIAAGLTVWDWSTTPAEQIEAIKESEDMKEIEKNMKDLQDLIDKKNNKDRNKECP